MITKKQKQDLARKYKELAYQIQFFFDSQSAEIVNARECEVMIQAQLSFKAAHEELTGKPKL